MSITEHQSPQTSGEINVPPSFPKGFLWGAATSAYQIEGAVCEDGRGPSVWDRFAAMPGATYQGQTGEITTDHYHRMEEDVALMAEMHLSAYRFSISWPRVLPHGTGDVNERGLDFYSRLVDALLARGIQPLVTLYHWDLPIALQEQGGWLSRDTASAFADYAEVVTSRLGDRVKWWITHNEPWCTSYLGYALGIHAPGLRDVQQAALVGHHVLLSHGLAVQRMRSLLPSDAQLGIAIDFYPVYPVDDQLETLQGVQQADTFRNRWFLDPVMKGSYPPDLFTDMGVQPPPIEPGDMQTIATPIDFLGVNYYTRMLVEGVGGNGISINGVGSYRTIDQVPGSAYTETGWEIFPAGLTNILTRIHREYAPRAMIVTESGAAFADQWDGNGHINDQQRIDYLRMHIQTLARAIHQGVPIKGYCVWSLLDNFEWAEGYRKRFGLIYVDYPTQRRIVKDSGLWYADFIRQQRA